MTLTILARDPATGAMGGASATGNLCVGAWVLRGDARAGLSASQGATPSTLWGEDLIDAMRDGAVARDAVERVTSGDPGRAQRQVLALDTCGRTAVYTGSENLPQCHEVSRDNLVVAGNMLMSTAVVDACLDGFHTATGPFPHRLLVALETGAAAGGDFRGLMSAALLVISPKHPPLNLRVDFGESPLGELQDLLRRTQEQAYANWLMTLPTRSRLGS